MLQARVSEDGSLQSSVPLAVPPPATITSIPSPASSIASPIELSASKPTTALSASASAALPRAASRVHEGSDQQAGGSVVWASHAEELDALALSRLVRELKKVPVLYCTSAVCWHHSCTSCWLLENPCHAEGPGKTQPCCLLHQTGACSAPEIQPQRWVEQNLCMQQMLLSLLLLLRYFWRSGPILMPSLLGKWHWQIP